MTSRRTLLKTGLAAVAPVAFGRDGNVHAYVGSYTTAQRQARGDGIHAYRIDGRSGPWTHFQHIGNLVNPSLLISSRDQRVLYSAHGDERYATAFSIDRETRELTPLGQADTGGTNGVHLALSRSGKFMVLANYGSGTVAVLPVRDNGALSDHSQLVELPGKPGPHRVEQTSSHPHQVVFDPSGRFLLVPDKGLDRVFVFRFDDAAGRLSPTEQASVSARAGSGPRHLAFHPKAPVVWTLNELSSTVTTYAWDAERGALHPLQILTSLPANFTGDNTAAEIAVSSDGRFVYCSNRGHDSVAVFAANARTGLLTPIAWTPTKGRSPRFITLDPAGRFLYAANEQGDTIAQFRVDPAHGVLRSAGEFIRTASPVTIAFAGFH